MSFGSSKILQNIRLQIIQHNLGLNNLNWLIFHKAQPNVLHTRHEQQAYIYIYIYIYSAVDSLNNTPDDLFQRKTRCCLISRYLFTWVKFISSVVYACVDESLH